MAESVLQGKVAIVTGAGSPIGIGHAITLGLIRAGARVAMLDINQAWLEQSAHEMRSVGGADCVLPIMADITDPDAVAQAVRRTIAELGGLHILVNNAGTNPRAAGFEAAGQRPSGNFWDITPAAWSRVIAVNFTGAFLMARDDLAIGDLAEGPRILTDHANRAAPLLGQPGVVQYQEALRWTLGHEGLDALLVEGLRVPGRIGQEMLQAFGRGPCHRRGDGVTVLARQVGQQAREVALHALPAGRAAEERCEGLKIRGKFWQGLWTSFRDNGCVHIGEYDFHVAKGEYGCNYCEHKYITKLTK